MDMSLVRRKRIPIEVKSVNESSKSHGIICIIKSDSDFTNLEAQIPGPKESAYESGIFKVNINITNEYPFAPPVVKFLTPILHPNVDTSGNICLDVLRRPPNGSYNPGITLEAILISIQLLLSSPNTNSPLNSEISDLYAYDKSKFNEVIKKHVQKHAIDGFN